MGKLFQKPKVNAMITGRNIYRTSKGGLLYYNKRMNLVYRIPSNKESLFKTYQSRYVLCLIALILLSITFQVKLVYSIGLFVLFCALFEWRYRSFLKSCSSTKGFLKSDHAISMDQYIDLDNPNLILRILLYGAFAVLLVVNAITSKNVSSNPGLQVGSYIIAVAAAFFCCKYISILARNLQKTKRPQLNG